MAPAEGAEHKEQPCLRSACGHGKGKERLRKELVAAGQVLSHPVPVVMLETALKKKKIFKAKMICFFKFFSLQCIRVMLYGSVVLIGIFRT